jgi:hypothetical protein
MTPRLHGPIELTYGATHSIDRLTGATDEIRRVIMNEVPDRDACSAALTLVAKALCVAVHAVPLLTERRR